METRIKKIKFTPTDKISIQYEKRNPKISTWDEYSMTCADLPRPQLRIAMQNLRTYVIEMCELPKNYLDRITVTGVSFSYGGEKEVMGATITSQMKLSFSNCGLNLNTPHKASESYTDYEADPKQLLSCECIVALDELCDEVIKYINGERAQVSMFAVV